MLQMENISKSFPGVKALDNVQLTVNAGEVHALVGENGAGKSTLIKILMGVYKKDTGSIKIKGKNVKLSSPLDAQKEGLAAVYQDVMMASHLTVGENFYMGKLPCKRGLVDWAFIFKQTQAHLDELGIYVDVRQKISDLTVAMQEMVSIAKLVWQGADIIIFDEPTALLTNSETALLFRLIEKLQKQNKAIIYISHRMEEIFKLCERATILKDGCYVDTVFIKDETEDSLVEKMVGRDVSDIFPPREKKANSTTVLSVEGISRKHAFENIHFSLHEGEILGIYGLVGSGRTEVMRAIFGADKIDEGKLTLFGKPYIPRSPQDAISKHMALICEDRKNQSLALPMNVRCNINLAQYKKISSLGFIHEKTEKKISRDYIEKLNIRTPSDRKKVAELSGGNQQKIVISKWLATDAKIIFFDEPTIGVDVGAREEIYQLISSLSSRNISSIIVSSYLPEVMGLADRIMVMHEGKCIDIVDGKTATEEQLIRLASAITS